MTKEDTSKRQKTDDVDIITELPRHVIDVIMEHLPLYDAARVSVLSHKWPDIWRSIPKLAFDAQFFKRVFKCRKINTHEFHHIVSRILFYHSGPLLGFRLEIPNLTSCPDVNQWIYYLSKTSVSDICIQNQYGSNPHKLSAHIFYCSNLEKLKLKHCTINPPNNYEGFRKMTYLELDRVVINLKALTSLIRSCPLLQELRFINFVCMACINIVAPNLCHLTVDGTFKSVNVINAEKLVSAVIGLHKHVDVSHQDRLGILLQALATSPKLQTLVFRGHFVKGIYGMVLPPPTFEKLRNLDLLSIHMNDIDEFCSIISIIQNCPAIERLNISVSTSKNETDHLLEYNPNVVLQRLCYANVEICKGSNMELMLIEFLLKCSPVLKKLSITPSASSENTFTQAVLLELVSFCRASQNVKVRCLPPVSVNRNSPTDSFSDGESDSSSEEDSSESEEESSSDEESEAD